MLLKSLPRSDRRPSNRCDGADGVRVCSHTGNMYEMNPRWTPKPIKTLTCTPCPQEHCVFSIARRGVSCVICMLTHYSPLQRTLWLPEPVQTRTGDFMGSCTVSDALDYAWRSLTTLDHCEPPLSLAAVMEGEEGRKKNCPIHRSQQCFLWDVSGCL